MKRECTEEESILREFLLETNLPLKDIAKNLNWTDYKLSKEIKRLGLGWIRRSDRKLSRGHAALFSVMQKIAQNEKVVVEHHIGERLRLDVYCPSLKVALEFHGRQHFEFVHHFHKTIEAFVESQDRDMRKEELCKELGIALVVFRYNDDLSEDVVYSRILDAIRSTPPAKEKQSQKSRFKGNPYYESAKQRDREWRKERYRKMKAQKKET